MKNFILLLLLLAGVSAPAQTVYKTPSGEKFHTADCRMIKNKSQALSVEDAQESGLSPCKICKPAVSVQKITAGSGRVSGEKSKSIQCLGRTKKGLRCKHQTQIGNGYCFQHQPG